MWQDRPLTNTGLVSYTAPFFINPNDLNWGAKYAYVWAGSNACVFGEWETDTAAWRISIEAYTNQLATIVFFYFLLPEMKDRSLEELDELFQNRVSVRDFRKYQCVSSERAKEIASKEMGDQKGEVVVETVENSTDSKVWLISRSNKSKGCSGSKCLPCRVVPSTHL